MNSQFVFRQAAIEDVDEIYLIAKSSSGGMTSLPTDKKLIEEQLERSINSFTKKVTKPNDEKYIFVLEDVIVGGVVGVCAIEARVGSNKNAFWYKCKTKQKDNQVILDNSKFHSLLIAHDYVGDSEICSLFLLHEYRHTGIGVLLSKARFIFMKLFEQRFSNKVFAEMRGFINEDGESPFWNEVGKNLFNINYKQAESMRFYKTKEFADQLIKADQIDLKLLSVQAIDSIGKPHDSTKPAYNMLVNENFTYQQCVHAFDAGPVLVANLKDIAILSKLKSYTLIKIEDVIDEDECMVTNSIIYFRAMIGPVKFIGSDQICLEANMVQHMNLSINDQVQVIRKFGE